MGSPVDWTQVLVALVAGIPASLGAVLTYLVVRRIRTPSGQSIGVQVEQTNHLAHANVAITKDIHRAVGNGESPTNTEA